MTEILGKDKQFLYFKKSQQSLSPTAQIQQLLKVWVFFFSLCNYAYEDIPEHTHRHIYVICCLAVFYLNVTYKHFSKFLNFNKKWKFQWQNGVASLRFIISYVANPLKLDL